MDPRIKYLATVAASMFGVQNLAPKIAQSDELLRFLEEEKIKALQILTDGQNLKVLLGLGIPPKDIMNVTFLKNLTNENEINMKNIRSCVQVTNIIDSSPIVSLHNLVQKIFYPLIQEEAPEKSNFIEMVYQLRTALVMEARKRGSKLSKFDYDITKFKGILEPTDELEIWKSLIEETDLTDQNKSLYNTASILNKHFEKFHVIFPKMSHMPLGNITGCIPTIKNTLDRIWNDGSINPPEGYP